VNVESINPYIPLQWQTVTEDKAAQPEGTAFADTLKKALYKVNSLQIKADEAATALATGQAEDVHQVVIALEEAMLAMQLTMQVRNKILEAYQEISRMQI
jgi:flagellar hook-basal body complex protein FliE